MAGFSFGRLSPQARDALDRASLAPDGHVDTGHVLAGLCGLQDNRFRLLLTSLGITARDLVNTIGSLREPTNPEDLQGGLSGQAKVAIQVAIEEAISHNRAEVGPEYLLLALARVDGLASSALRFHGIVDSDIAYRVEGY